MVVVNIQPFFRVGVMSLAYFFSGLSYILEEFVHLLIFLNFPFMV